MSLIIFSILKRGLRRLLESATASARAQIKRLSPVHSLFIIVFQVAAFTHPVGVVDFIFVLTFAV